ncbi:XGD1, partial [Symbiodinium necroappetens]
DSLSSAGPPVKDYFRRSGLSRFCLIPAGLTAWTIHLYESFFFGCIPVLLSDEVSVPFQDEIDWPRLSFKVPSSIDMAELHTRLRSVRFGQLKSMYRELAAARCWFDYSRGWGAEGRSEE